MDEKIPDELKEKDFHGKVFKQQGGFRDNFKRFVRF